MAILNPSIESLLADSVESGKRSKLYSIQYSLQNFGDACGPLVTIILFLIMGDNWNLNDLNIVIYLGISLGCVSIFLLFFVRDKYSLGKSSEAYTEAQTTTEESTEMEDKEQLAIITRSKAEASGTEEERASLIKKDNEEDQKHEKMVHEKGWKVTYRKKFTSWVGFIVVASNFLFG